MARHSKQPKTSEQTQSEALKIARSIQKPGQSKQQTKLIEQGIRKGIDAYKKQQKAKSRALNKQLKKAASHQPAEQDRIADESSVPSTSAVRLPWLLLVLSWTLFAGYLLIGR